MDEKGAADEPNFALCLRQDQDTIATRLED